MRLYEEAYLHLDPVIQVLEMKVCIHHQIQSHYFINKEVKHVFEKFSHKDPFFKFNYHKNRE